MQPCRWCLYKGHIVPADEGLMFYRATEFDPKYGCRVHRCVEDTGRPTMITFCQNDPQARAAARRCARESVMVTTLKRDQRKRPMDSPVREDPKK
jgi:hypothetical protein